MGMMTDKENLPCIAASHPNIPPLFAHAGTTFDAGALSSDQDAPYSASPAIPASP